MKSKIMKKNSLKLMAAASLLCMPFISSVSTAASVSTAVLQSFIQTGSVMNSASSGGNISAIVYDLGTAGDGIATWDTGVGGGVASNFLSDPRYFQTVTWSGLSVAPGDVFSFAGLDIDVITTLTPFSASGAIPLDGGTASLVNATLSIFWDNGDFGSVSLEQQAWTLTQNLRIDSVVPVPAAVWLFGSGLVGLLGVARRRAAA